MKSQQYDLFNSIPVDAVFHLQDSLFNLVFWLAIWAHFSAKAPNKRQFLGLYVIALLWGALQATSILWDIVDFADVLKEASANIFNRLNFLWALYLCTYLALLGRYIVAPKHARTVFRGFMILICFVSIGTFSLFHYVVIGGGLFEGRYARDEMVMSMLRNDAPEELILKVCDDMEFWCGISENPESFVGDTPEVQDAIDNLVSWQMFELRDQRRVTKQIHHYLSPDKFQLGIYQTVSGYIDRRGDTWIFIFDKKRFDDMTRKYTIYASLLISAAHLAWLIGGFLLISLHESGRIHKYAMRYKNAQKLKAREDARQDTAPPPASDPTPPAGNTAP